MAHIYKNKTSGQVVVSEEPIAHLEGVARWEHSEGKAPKSEKPVDIPEGKPSEEWTVDQLKAYAERESIDLGDAKKKDELVAVLVK